MTIFRMTCLCLLVLSFSTALAQARNRVFLGRNNLASSHDQAGAISVVAMGAAGTVDPARLPGPTATLKQFAQNSLGSPLRKRASRTIRDDLDLSPTPEPTGDPSSTTTVHIAHEWDFALILPNRPGELISDAESDGVSYCTTGSTDPSCTLRVQDGFIRAAAVSRSDDGRYIQVTGCLDASKSTLDPSDSGGQMDVRFPNGAQCTFGGYGASFIQIVEPAVDRFCLRCCSSADDQVNCNSHQDTAGCPAVIPGTYSFPDLGVSCD